MYTEEEVAAELDKDEDFDYKKVLDMYRVSPEVVQTVQARRLEEAGERKARTILYKHRLVQQHRASQREKRERSLLAEVPQTVDENYWASLMATEPVDDDRF